MARNDELVRVAKKAADAWRNTDSYYQAAQIIDMLVEELESTTLTQPNEGAKDKNVPTNEPLTLEELREMNGEPVWGKSLITEKPGEWFILRVVEMSKTWFIACAGAEQGFGDKDTYGKTWLAYRRPPEGEEETAT